MSLSCVPRGGVLTKEMENGMNKTIALLGSTGSIGTQTLDVARGLGLSVCALAARSNITLLERQIREFRPRVAAVFDSRAASQLRVAVADTSTRVLEGMEGLCEAASLGEADLVCNAVVGMVGLQPTLAAIEAGKDIALANKETLVAGGALVTARAEEKGVRLFPVDSEHSAIFQCLQGSPRPGGCLPPHPHGVRRPLLRQNARRACLRHTGAGAAPPELEHGGEDHRGFRHHDEQGPRDHGGPRGCSACRPRGSTSWCTAKASSIR